MRISRGSPSISSRTMATAYPPDTPADISAFFENGKYVFRAGDGLSIYVYDRDKTGVPTCTGQCAKEWPPVIASADSKPVGAWTLVERAEGSKQWRFRNRPVYTNAKDKLGETSGNGIDGVWHLLTA